jgi:hypothetical protein
MIVAVDLIGGIVLYSGMNLVGKVHVAGIPSALTTSSYLSLNLGSQFASPFPRYVNVITVILDIQRLRYSEYTWLSRSYPCFYRPMNVYHYSDINGQMFSA